MKSTPPKSEWPPGPWHDEPDRLEWSHLGFPCLMRRGGSGAWCGYVAVPPGHPWHGNSDTDHIEAHGGITYGGPCEGDICHEAKDGEPDNVWWLGFDCHHCDDLAPADAALLQSLGRVRVAQREVYRDLAYVKSEVESLAAQALAAR